MPLQNDIQFLLHQHPRNSRAPYMLTRFVHFIILCILKFLIRLNKLTIIVGINIVTFSPSESVQCTLK